MQANGANLGSFPVNGSPIEVVFDGNDLWVSTGAIVDRLRASDGKVLGIFHTYGGPTGLAFDGANIWVTNFDSGTVSKF